MSCSSWKLIRYLLHVIHAAGVFQDVFDVHGNLLIGAYFAFCLACSQHDLGQPCQAWTKSCSTAARSNADTEVTTGSTVTSHNGLFCDSTESHMVWLCNCTFCAFTLAPLHHYSHVSGCRVLWTTIWHWRQRTLQRLPCCHWSPQRFVSQKRSP